MTLTERLELLAMAAADHLMARWPQKKPDKSFKEARVISHRGHFDNIHIFENTIEAFKSAMLIPCYGVELDIRWTKELEPVVSHDNSLKRVFGIDRKVNELNFKELKEVCPKVPHLSEVLSEIHGAHFMIELKRDQSINWEKASAKLKEHLCSVRPAIDFHLLSFGTYLFDYFKEYPGETFLPIAKLNVSSLSQQTLKQGWGGLTGHYIVVGEKYIELHHRSGQKVGLGVVKTINSLCREINRGADYIFSDRAHELYKQFPH